MAKVRPEATKAILYGVFTCGDVRDETHSRVTRLRARMAEAELTGARTPHRAPGARVM